MVQRVFAMRLLLVTLFAASVSGCSIQKITGPFPEALPYGEIVRDIRIEGNRHTATWIVLGAMKSQIGEPYTEESATTDYLWLSRLGTFTSIVFSAEDADDGIVLVVTVAEISPYIPSISLALTQENGIEIGPAFSSPNLFGWAARASAYARFGGTTNIGIRYRDPWMPGRSWLFGYKAEYFHRERENVLDNFGETSDEFNFQLRRNAFSDDFRLGFRFTYLTVKSDSVGRTLSPDNRDKIPAVGLFVELDKRNAAYPTNGWFAEAEVAKWGIFGGDGDYWQVSADLRRYQQLPFGPGHSLAISSFLTMTSGEVGVDIPIYMDFHIGGTNSVRGWPLGSREGKNQWLNTLEYWMVLVPERAFRVWFVRWRMGLQVAAFGDVGTAWSTSQQFGDNFIGGFGGGVRLTIPVVVLLRLDLGYAQNQWGIKIHIGGGEKAEAQRYRVR